MSFVSFQFVLFLAATLGVHHALAPRFRRLWLLAASLFFYGWAEPVYLLQILAASAAAFYAAQRIEAAGDKHHKQAILTPTLLLLVGNLFVFKYTSFLNETLRGLFGWAGASYDLPAIHIVLPLGISFYTFLLIGYLIDVFRGDKAERDPGIFALFALFFPKVVAGPIERSKNLLPQLKAEHRFDSVQAVLGLQLILWGAFKKIVVADRIAPFVDQVYSDPHAFDGVTMTLATWLYAFQIYCDFSGYTDMALGIALLFGYKLLPNFNRPYFATSIQDFWKRWHMSLTAWLTDYVYTPLTRQRIIKMKFYNMMLWGLFITFVVSGLWHGAAWNYVLWGALHGGFIVATLLLQKPQAKFVKRIGLDKRPKLYRGLKIAATFTLVCFAYIFFRASSMEDAFYIVTHLGTGWGEAFNAFKVFTHQVWGEFALALAGIAVVIAVDVIDGRKVKVGERIAAGPAWRRWAIYYAGAVSILLLGAFYSLDQQFIYFRF